MTSQGHNPCSTTSKTIAIMLLHTQIKNKLPDPDNFSYHHQILIDKIILIFYFYAIIET